MDGGIGDISHVWLIFWVALVTISLISVIIFSCADGVSKDKTSTGDTNLYGGGCAAGCGTVCGGGCGAWLLPFLSLVVSSNTKPWKREVGHDPNLARA